MLGKIHWCLSFLENLNTNNCLVIFSLPYLPDLNSLTSVTEIRHYFYSIGNCILKGFFFKCNSIKQTYDADVFIGYHELFISAILFKMDHNIRWFDGRI